MTSSPTATHLRASCLPTSSVVFVVGGDPALRQTLDTLAYDAGWRTETVKSIGALSHQERTLPPSCLVLDVTQLDPRNLLPPHLPTDIPVICITTAGDVSLSVRAMKAGAVDVLTKPVEISLLLEAIQLALLRDEEGFKLEAELLELRARYDSLSHREREVMALVVFGLMNKQVGWELGISEITVKAHRGRVMRAMKAQTLAHLVIMAARLQIADLRNPHHLLGNISIKTSH